MHLRESGDTIAQIVARTGIACTSLYRHTPHATPPHRAGHGNREMRLFVGLIIFIIGFLLLIISWRNNHVFVKRVVVAVFDPDGLIEALKGIPGCPIVTSPPLSIYQCSCWGELYQPSPFSYS